MATNKKASKAKSSKSQKSSTPEVTVMTPSTNIRLVKSNNTKVDLQRAIRARAYELFLQRGGQHGHDFEDWLRAEAELRAQYQERTA
jgi:hypothetical protein